MKLKKRIAAMGAAIMMAVSMMSVNASAANTNTINSQALLYANAKANDSFTIRFFPKNAMTICYPGDPRNNMAESEERFYGLKYDHAALRPSVSIKVPKNTEAGTITVIANYLQNKQSVSPNSKASLKIQKCSKDMYYIIDNRSFSERFDVKRNIDHVTVRFQIKASNESLAKRTKIQCVECEVKYSN